MFDHEGLKYQVLVPMECASLNLGDYHNVSPNSPSQELHGVDTCTMPSTPKKQPSYAFRHRLGVNPIAIALF